MNSLASPPSIPSSGQLPRTFAFGSLLVSLALTLTGAGCAKSKSTERIDGEEADQLAALELELDGAERELGRAGVRVGKLRGARLARQERSQDRSSRGPRDAAASGSIAEEAGGGALAPNSELEKSVAANEDAEHDDEPTQPSAAAPAEPTLSPAPPSDQAYDAIAEGSSARTRSSTLTRCEKIAQLAVSSCGLSDRICDLARAHAGEARFEQACERSQLVCDAALEANDDCE